MWRRRSWCRDGRSSELWRLEPLALARKAMWMRGDGLAALRRKLHRRADEITLSIQALPDGGGWFESASETMKDKPVTRSSSSREKQSRSLAKAQGSKEL
uniref:Uncharacterized protein n=1 Tax=Oryza barthii TaxID=65489 RepID=A0A0D3H6T9_9ORYZ